MFMHALEPRILFDAAGLLAGLDVFDADSDTQIVTDLGEAANHNPITEAADQTTPNIATTGLSAELAKESKKLDIQQKEVLKVLGEVVELLSCNQ